jgi:uncharacterized Zn finger protein
MTEHADYSQFSAETLTKARRVVDTDKITPDKDHPTEIFWVKGSGDATYRVQVGQGQSYITCTCPHGIHAGGGMTKCYHGAAAQILLDRKEIANRGFAAGE